MDPNNSVITIRPAALFEPPSVVEQRTAYLQRRHHLSPALAGVIAELAYAAGPGWRARAAQ